MKITRVDAVEFTAYAYSPTDLILYWASFKGLFGSVERFEVVGQLYAFDFQKRGVVSFTGTKAEPLLVTHVENGAVFILVNGNRTVRALASDTRTTTLEVYIRNRRP